MVEDLIKRLLHASNIVMPTEIFNEDLAQGALMLHQQLEKEAADALEAQANELHEVTVLLEQASQQCMLLNRELLEKNDTIEELEAQTQWHGNGTSGVTEPFVVLTRDRTDKTPMKMHSSWREEPKDV